MGTLMGCSDVAAGTHAQAHDGLPENHPSCVSDYGIHPLACVPAVTTPNLEGRFARCGTHGVVPSSTKLAFFEFCGEGSREAVEICRCKYAKVAHGEINQATKRKGITDHKFEAQGPLEFDRYYDGCRGWD